ncbi:MAG: ATP-binding cassette domain-containing protein [Candidatus Bathyarchaeia archaeon]
MIELKDVVKRYGDVEALRGVSLEVRRGEVLTIVGPNGSGKTTLLRILAALERPTSGEVYLEGVRIDEANSALLRRSSTMVFQTAIVFRGSVYDNVAYGLRLSGRPKEEVDRRIKEALEVVGLSGLEGRSARGLSGGERQRLSLARALALERELLLLDEPTANLDPESLSVVTEPGDGDDHRHGDPQPPPGRGAVRAAHPAGPGRDRRGRSAQRAPPGPLEGDGQVRPVGERLLRLVPHRRGHLPHRHRGRPGGEGCLQPLGQGRRPR